MTPEVLEVGIWTQQASPIYNPIEVENGHQNLARQFNEGLISELIEAFMSDTQKENSKNLLIEAAKRKAANVSSGNKPGILGKDLSRQYSFSQNKFFKPTKPGGRNGNGKPS